MGKEDDERQMQREFQAMQTLQIMRTRCQEYTLYLKGKREEDLTEQEKIAIAIHEREFDKAGINLAEEIKTHIARCAEAFWQQTVIFDPHAPVPELPEASANVVAAQRQIGLKQLEEQFAPKIILPGQRGS